MAIQMKRGKLSELDTSLLQAGEIIIATDKDFVAYTKAPSGIVPLATKKEVINAIKGATLVDVVDGCFTFKQSRSQPKLSYIRDFEVGSTYDIEYGNGKETVQYAIKEFIKCCNPHIIYNKGENYDNVINALKSIMKECRNVVSDTEFVYIYCNYNTRGSYNGTISISVYHGAPRNSEFTIYSKNSFDSKIGRTYYNLQSPYPYLDGRMENYRVYTSGEYDHTSQDYSVSIPRLGIYASATQLTMSNLGLKTDRVINDNDWEWDFSKCETKIVDDKVHCLDLVDGLAAVLYWNSVIEDDCLVLNGRDSFTLLPYLVQCGRKVEIDFGICERHYDVSTFSTNYPMGLVVGNYISNSSQYATPYYGLEMASYSVGSGNPKMRIRGAYDSSDPVEVTDPNFLSEKKLFSYVDPSTGNWKIKIDNKEMELEYNPYALVNSRIGTLSARSADTALYITRIKKIKVN